MTELTGPAAGPMAFQPIVVGVDPSDTVRIVANKAAELAQVLRAPVHLVCAAYRPRGGGSQADGVLGDARDDPALCRALAEAAGPFRERGVKAKLHACAGDPAEAILAIAEEQRARMIVIGSRGMHGARRYLLGDVPNKVAHHAPCGVMILKTCEDYSDRGTMLLAG